MWSIYDNLLQSHLYWMQYIWSKNINFSIILWYYILDAQKRTLFIKQKDKETYKRKKGVRRQVL